MAADKTSRPRILGISGALRAPSTNTLLLHEALRLFGPAETQIADLRLPLYDGDLEAAEGIPDGVTTLADQVARADGIVIASPEYNKGIPGVLKNALDWVSRVPGRAFADKPVALIAAAGGRAGGETAHYMVRHCLTPLGAHVLHGPGVLVAQSSGAFDEAGRLTGEVYTKALTALMGNLRDRIDARAD